MLCTRLISVPGRYYTWDFNDGSTFSYKGRALRKLKANVAGGDDAHLYDGRAVYIVDPPPMAKNSLGLAAGQRDNAISGAGFQFEGEGGAETHDSVARAPTPMRAFGQPGQEFPSFQDSNRPLEDPDLPMDDVLEDLNYGGELFTQAYAEAKALDPRTEDMSDYIEFDANFFAPMFAEAEAHLPQQPEAKTEYRQFDEEFFAPIFEEAELDLDAFLWLQSIDTSDINGAAGALFAEPQFGRQQPHNIQQHVVAPVPNTCQCQSYVDNNITGLGQNVTFPHATFDYAMSVFPAVDICQRRDFNIGVYGPRQVEHQGRQYLLVCKLLVERCLNVTTRHWFDKVWMQGEWMTSIAAATQSLLNMLLAIPAPWRGDVPVKWEQGFQMSCSVCRLQRPQGWII